MLKTYVKNLKKLRVKGQAECVTKVSHLRMQISLRFMNSINHYVEHVECIKYTRKVVEMSRHLLKMIVICY